MGCKGTHFLSQAKLGGSCAQWNLKYGCVCFLETPKLSVFLSSPLKKTTTKEGALKTDTPKSERRHGFRSASAFLAASAASWASFFFRSSSSTYETPDLRGLGSKGGPHTDPLIHSLSGLATKKTLCLLDCIKSEVELRE